MDGPEMLRPSSLPSVADVHLHLASIDDSEVTGVLKDDAAHIDVLSKSDQLLLESAESGKQVGVLDALKDRADVNIFNNLSRKTALHLSAERGHLAIVKLLVDKANADPNITDRDSYTPLHYAAKEGHQEIVSLLLEKGSIASHSNESGKTALHLAAENGHLNITELLLSKGADPDSKDWDGRDCLHCAIESGSLAIVKLLLEGKVWKVDVNSEDNLQRRPLHLAVKNGCHDIVQVLIDHKASLNCKDKDGKIPLHYTAMSTCQHSDNEASPSNSPSGSPSFSETVRPSSSVIVELFIDSGVDVNFQDKDGRTLLHYAAEKLNEDLVNTLLVNNANPDIKDKEGNTALHLAVYFTSETPLADVDETSMDIRCVKGQSVVKLLLNRKADTNIRNEMGHTVLQYAVTSNNKDMLILLLDGGTDLNKRLRKASDQMTGSMAEVQDDETPLHFAVRKKLSAIVSLLVNRGAFRNLTDTYGRTPLHYSICAEDHDGTEFLLDNGADKSINVPDTLAGMTPLHYAAANGIDDALFKKMLKLQKRANIDMESKCEKGKTPLHYAAEKDHANICRLLINQGAKVNHRSKEGRTALMYAAANNCRNSVRQLLDKEASVDIEDNDGKTVLHIAVENEHRKVVNIFLGRKMRSSYYDKNGKTPLHYAAEMGNERIVYELIEKRMNPDDINKISGKKALHYAAENGHAMIVLVLLLVGHHGDCTDKLGHTALHYAVKNNHKAVIEKIMWYATRTKQREKDVPISIVPFIMPSLQEIVNYGRVEVQFLSKSQTGLVDCLKKWSPLHYAVETDSFETVALLVEQVKVDCIMEDGWTPLHFASRRGSLDVVELLLEHNSSVEYINRKVSTSQMTAIHFAARNGHKDVVSVLLQHGADVVMNDKDLNGLTPLQYLAESNLWDLATFSNDHSNDKYCSAAILRSAKNGEEDTVERLIQLGADSNSRDKVSQKTALHFAAENKHHSVIDLLLTAGADPNIKDKAGRTPLNSSYLAGSDQSMQLIQSAGGTFDCNHLLLAAAMKPDIRMLEKSLEDGANIDFPVTAEETDDPFLRDRKTALHYAVIKGHYDAVKFLLSKEVNFDCQDKGNFTPVHYAVINGDSNILRLLIDKGVDLNLTTELQEKGALHFAAERNSLEILELLINSEGIIVDIEDSDHKTPLHYAAMNKTTCTGYDMMELLIEHKANVNHEDKWKRTALHISAENGHKEMVEMLVDNKAKRNIDDMFDCTPLHEAASKGHHEIVKILIDKHDADAADVNQTSQTRMYTDGIQEYNDQLSPCAFQAYQKPALHCAAANGHVKVVEILLDNGAIVDFQDIMGKTPMHHAAENGHIGIVKLLMDRDADKAICDTNNMLPVHFAARNGHQDIAELLQDTLSDEFSIWYQDEDHHLKSLKSLLAKHEVDENWRTSVNCAAENGHCTVAKFLIEKKAKLNRLLFTDYDFAAPLHLAVKRKHLEFVSFMMQYVSDDDTLPWTSAGQRLNINITTMVENKTPICIAAEVGHKDIVLLLLQNGADQSIKTKDDKTPLHIAAENGRTEVVQILLENGAVINCEDELAKTALHYAAEKGHISTVELLIEKGANFFDRTKSQLSPLQLAASGGHETVVKYLLSKEPHNVEYRRSGPNKCLGRNARAVDTAYIYSHRTALHYATVKMSKIVVKSLISSQVNVNSQDEDMMTPLHLATQRGSEEIVNLLCNAQADVNITGQGGLTAMHIAARRGHVRVAKRLHKSGAKMDEKDPDGMTPLHYACQNSHVAMTEYLLSTGSVNPISETFDRKNTPMDLVPPDSKDRTKLLQLFQPFVESYTNFPIESYSKVFLCGYSTAGKSSLGQVIIIRSKKRRNHKFDPYEFVTGVTPFTAGIEPHTVCSPEIGNVILYDFAGHTEYYSSHSAIVENLMVRSPGVFIIVVDLTKPKDVKRGQLLYWFNFIQNTCAKISKQSQVIVVGSRADQFDNEGWEFNSFIDKLAKLGLSRLSDQLLFKGFVPMECHRPGGKGVVKFISLLDQSCKDVIDRSDGISYYCHVLYSFLKDLKEVAITLDQLCIKIEKELSSSLPKEASIVSDLLSTLSDKGLILFIRGSNWIIVNKTILLKEIIGVLFAPASIKRVHQKIASNTGIVAVSTLTELFPNYDPQMLKGFLISLEFCQVIDPEFLGVMNVSSSSYSTGELLFFPSLIDENFSSGLSSGPTFGWCLWCPDYHSFFTTRFLHVLLLRLALGHCLNASPIRLDIDDESEEFERQCKVWKNGICWKNYGIEVFVEMSENNHCITVLVSGKEFKRHEICCSVIKEVHDLKNHLCPCDTEDFIIAPNQLMDIREKEVKDRFLIPLQKVAHAMILQNEDMVSDVKGENAFTAEIILGIYEPYFSVSPLIIQELFDPSLAQEQLPASRVKCLQLACAPDVMKGITTPLTHQEMRSHLQKCSIFTVHNPLKMAKDCMNEKEKKWLSGLLSMSLVTANQERKPTKRELMRLLSNDVSSYWNIMGYHLGVNSDKLHSLQNSNKPDDVRLGEMLDLWLMSKSDCKWDDIIDFLKLKKFGKLALDVLVSLGQETEEESAVIADPKPSPVFLEQESKELNATDEPMMGSTPLKVSSEKVSSSLLSPVKSFPTSNEMEVDGLTPVYSQRKKDSEMTESEKSTTPTSDDATLQNLTAVENNSDMTEQSVNPMTGGSTSDFSIQGESAPFDTKPLVEANHSKDQSPSFSLPPQERMSPHVQTLHTKPLLGTCYSKDQSPSSSLSPQKRILPNVEDIPSHTAEDFYTENDNVQELGSAENEIPSLRLETNLKENASSMLAFIQWYSLLVFTFLNNLALQSSPSSHLHVSDTDLRKCSRYLGRLSKLAGYLGVPDRYLQQIQEEYSDREIQSYWLLKKWKEMNPRATRLELIEILQYLELTEAVESLMSS